MKNQSKILLAVPAVVIIVGVVFYAGNSGLFQGRIFRSVQEQMFPAYNESKCYDSDGGENYEKNGITYGKMSVKDEENKYAQVSAQ